MRDDHGPTALGIGLLAGPVFAVVILLVVAAQQGWSRWAVVGSLVGGALFGLVMGPLLRRRLRQLGSPVADLTGAERREVLSATQRGPVPRDPALRQRAADLLATRHAKSVRSRPWFIGLFGAVTVLYGWLGLTWHTWAWAGVLVFGAAAVATALEPRWQERRLEVLAASRDDAPGPL